MTSIITNRRNRSINKYEMSQRLWKGMAVPVISVTSIGSDNRKPPCGITYSNGSSGREVD